MCNSQGWHEDFELESRRMADEPSDVDPRNPVNLTAEEWADLYSKMDDPESFMDHDHSMDG